MSKRVRCFNVNIFEILFLCREEDIEGFSNLEFVPLMHNHFSFLLLLLFYYYCIIIIIITIIIPLLVVAVKLLFIFIIVLLLLHYYHNYYCHYSFISGSSKTTFHFYCYYCFSITALLS